MYFRDTGYMKTKTERATFAAGCFWRVEENFRKIKGVVDVTVGYTGGQVDSPTYEAVCGGDTGHAEAVDVSFDPKIVSYEELVGAFWNMHDPTTKNRQGPDVGAQYRSAIFFHTDEQREIAERIKKELEQSRKYQNPIVTEIVSVKDFHRAEEYHQRYLEK
jgi:peptide-methionine (S)-S-oxide reductase